MALGRILGASLVFFMGLVAMVFPSVPLAIERWRRTHGENRRPEDVEFTDRYVLKQRVAGVIICLLAIWVATP